MSEQVVMPGGGEVIGDSPDRRVEILSDDASVNATWSRFGPGRDGADLHVHREHTDLFYVLGGELTVRLGPEGRPVTVPPGTLARVPPNVVHGFRNGSDGDMRYLNLHAPGKRFADYLRAVRDGREFSYDQHDPPADGGLPPAQAAVGGAELIGDGVMLLADVEAIRIIETRSEPREVATKAHDRHVASFYVLDGELAFTVEDRELPAPAGTWVQVPAGVPHAVAVAETARFLEIRTPS